MHCGWLFLFITASLVVNSSSLNLKRDEFELVEFDSVFGIDYSGVRSASYGFLHLYQARAISGARQLYFQKLDENGNTLQVGLLPGNQSVALQKFVVLPNDHFVVHLLVVVTSERMFTESEAHIRHYDQDGNMVSNGRHGSFYSTSNPNGYEITSMVMHSNGDFLALYLSDNRVTWTIFTTSPMVSGRGGGTVSLSNFGDAQSLQYPSADVVPGTQNYVICLSVKRPICYVECMEVNSNGDILLSVDTTRGHSTATGTYPQPTFAVGLAGGRKTAVWVFSDPYHTAVKSQSWDQSGQLYGYATESPDIVDRWIHSESFNDGEKVAFTTGRNIHVTTANFSRNQYETAWERTLNSNNRAYLKIPGGMAIGHDSILLTFRVQDDTTHMWAVHGRLFEETTMSISTSSKHRIQLEVLYILVFLTYSLSM